MARELKQSAERFSTDKRALKELRKSQRMQKEVSRSSPQKPRNAGTDKYK